MITMRVILSTDVTTPIAPDGQAATEMVTAAGQQARLRFTAAVGEKVFVDILSTASVPPSCGSIYLATVNGPTESLGSTSTAGPATSTPPCSRTPALTPSS
jgi:hypothetical protein